MATEVVPNLGDVPGPSCFWTHSGTVLCNIFDMAKWLEVCSEDDFRYHVNADHEKNDFAKWIAEVIGDRKLADRLEYVLDKKKYVKIVRKRLDELNRNL